MMKQASRFIYLVCISIALSFFVGCGDDDPTPVVEPPSPPHVYDAGTVGIYTDAEGTDSEIIDTGGLVTLYVVHKVPDGATASSFRVYTPPGWDLLGTTSPFPLIIGNINQGIAIAYGECMEGTILVLTLNYMSPGNSVPGTRFAVIPPPPPQDTENVEVPDCENQVRAGSGEDSPVSLPY